MCVAAAGNISKPFVHWRRHCDSMFLWLRFVLHLKSVPFAGERASVHLSHASPFVILSALAFVDFCTFWISPPTLPARQTVPHEWMRCVRAFHVVAKHLKISQGFEQPDGVLVRHESINNKSCRKSMWTFHNFRAARVFECTRRNNAKTIGTP